MDDTKSPESYLGYPEDSNLLLLEVAPVLLVDEHQVQVVPGTKLLIYIPERWCEIKPSKEKADWYCFALETGINFNNSQTARWTHLVLEHHP